MDSISPLVQSLDPPLDEMETPRQVVEHEHVVELFQDRLESLVIGPE